MRNLCHKLVAFGTSCLLFYCGPRRVEGFLAGVRLSQTRPTAPIAVFANSQKKDNSSINIAIVGGGPCGLLLGHLLSSKSETVRVSIFESRSDPRESDKPSAGRAYALGLGIRGRSAIRAVDEDLWQAVRERGFETERFQLHVGPFVIPLRGDGDTISKDGELPEPSLITFQSQLCAALVETLENRYKSTGRLTLEFSRKVQKVDLDRKCLSMEGSTRKGPFDLIVGCDGVNSVVRETIATSFPLFETRKERLPGDYKVVRLSSSPPSVDPKAVSLIFPKSGKISGFVEPTGSGSCCLLFSGNTSEETIINSSNFTFVNETLVASFPGFASSSEEIANQLIAQPRPGSASLVKCNIYHYRDIAVLAGDAAHATGGVSGQGVNSALQDAVALADAILECQNGDLKSALLTYSKKQVPEGMALYDLFFAPKAGGLKAVLRTVRTVIDTLFRGRLGIGRPPIQTRLTVSMEPFSAIRRQQDFFYPTRFPDMEEIQETLTKLDEKM